MPCYCGVKVTGTQLHLFWSLERCFLGLLISCSVEVFSETHLLLYLQSLFISSERPTTHKSERIIFTKRWFWNTIYMECVGNFWMCWKFLKNMIHYHHENGESFANFYECFLQHLLCTMYGYKQLHWAMVGNIEENVLPHLSFFRDVQLVGKKMEPAVGEYVQSTCKMRMRKGEKSEENMHSGLLTENLFANFCSHMKAYFALCNL